MSKICPNCKEVFDDEEFICGSCGMNLVEMTEKPNPTLNLGDANAISGGVSINQSKNITSHDTHYHSTTVHERSKSESELKLDANNQLRAKAEEIMAERGRIDSVAMSQLRPLALQLGIDEETFKTIIKDVRSNRNGGASGLSAANARYLQQAQQAVQTNDMDALSNLTPRLEAMAAICQDDNVQYLYYLTLSLFYPLKSMEVYERQADENYWRTFWAIISYIRTGKNAEATSTLALFDPLRYEKSEEDQNLLEAYFNIMKEDKDGAQEFLDEILGETSEQVKPLLRAVESTLYEEDAESLEVRFYMERVLTKSDVVIKFQKNAEPLTQKEEPSQKDSKTEMNQKTLPVPSEAQTINKSKEADELYTKACSASDAKRVMLLQKAADAGSLEAMFDLADCYADGDGVTKNIALAVKWVTKAADAGYAKAQLALGGMYLTGDAESGTDQNYSLSEKYLLMAAQKDNALAQGLLSILYIGMEEYEKALLWARKGAQLGDGNALNSLGRIYNEGLGVDVDHKKGLKWFEDAAKAGDADSQNICGNIYHDADFVEHDPEKSFNYYQMAAAQGHGYGMWNLGTCYMDGDGTAKNLALGEEWIRKAADAGIEEAIDAVKEVFDKPLEENDLDAELQKAQEAYDNGDYETAGGIWQNWAEQGNADAQFYLGVLYENGYGVAKNDKEAVKWYRKAAEQGDTAAQYNLGLMYQNGSGVNQSDKEAAKWYRKAAEQGDADAQMNLGSMYRYGNGVTQSNKEAVKWYRKAAELGNVWAMSNLAGLFSETGKDEDAKEWAQKALDNGYEEMDGEMKKIIENISLDPEVVFEKAWVTQADKTSLAIHVHYTVNNCLGRKLFVRFTTENATKDNRGTGEFLGHFDFQVVPEYQNTEWKDFVYYLIEKEQAWPNSNLGLRLKTTIEVLDERKKPLTPENDFWVAYSVQHRIRVFHDNELTLL